ncbi:MAG: hypothetical protein RID15_13860 [Marinovum algicola]|uniref:hypothetical protein n=1 Tax=Pseudomonadota TaxID=1224 RepID=UPI0032EB277D
MTERTEVTGEVVKLDYARLSNTKFFQCKLVYEGGRPPMMENCDFIECEFILEGAARNTQAFLTLLANSGAEDLVVHGFLNLNSWGPKSG